MTKFSIIVAIHFGDGLPLATSEEFLLSIKLDTILIELFEHLVSSSHHESKACFIDLIIT
jgi:hypothetical protein